MEDFILSDAELENLNEKELQILNKRIKEKLEVFANEKAMLAEQKKKYRMEEYAPTYTFNDHKFSQLVQKHFNSGFNYLTEEIYSQYVKQANRRDNIEYSKLYRCPECGRLTLRTSCCSDGTKSVYVFCDCCDFEVPKKYWEYYPSDAWEAFHKWLIKHNYLDTGTEFIR